MDLVHYANSVGGRQARGGRSGAGGVGGVCCGKVSASLFAILYSLY